ncbi:hypothetical protein BD626DRAFT_575716 [Schizophyllum amplum]|uniref:Uncharacterized protein n=1 Tax=Schizophyllum amplum TaxID=97359 RepID=A0A550BV33_9AGAR|nr:hypothetical protein BD626DRAFT_575716 [Auriculariopsis ampla]
MDGASVWHASVAAAGAPRATLISPPWLDIGIARLPGGQQRARGTAFAGSVKLTYRLQYGLRIFTGCITNLGTAQAAGCALQPENAGGRRLCNATGRRAAGADGAPAFYTMRATTHGPPGSPTTRAPRFTAQKAWREQRAHHSAEIAADDDGSRPHDMRNSAAAPPGGATYLLL